MARQRVVDRYEDVNGIKMAFIDTMQVWGKNPDDTDKEAPLQYSVPAEPQGFKAYILSLPDATFNDDKDAWEGPLAEAHQAFWSGFDTKKRQEQRESQAAESTINMVEKKKMSLITLPLNKLVQAIKGTLAAAVATGREPQNAFVVARKKLINDGKARHKEQSEMLELLPNAKPYEVK